MCVCVFSSRSFWTSSSLEVPAGVIQEEGHTGFLIHLSAVRALIFLAKRIQPFLSLVDREVEFLSSKPKKLSIPPNNREAVSSYNLWLSFYVCTRGCHHEIGRQMCYACQSCLRSAEHENLISCVHARELGLARYIRFDCPVQR